MKLQHNIPVYDFLGFKVLEAHLNRSNDTLLNYFVLRVNNNDFNEINKIYSLHLFVQLQFDSCEASNYSFIAGFKINDEEWMKSLTNKGVNQLFTSIVFPYIRNYINNNTVDSRGSINLPIIDLRYGDLEKGIKLILHREN